MMTSTVSSPPGLPWTCPFCALLCDGHAVALAPQAQLLGSRCPMAVGAVAGIKPLAVATPTVEGKPADYESALSAAADILGRCRQPLFGGLATDVAGCRGLYRLADACGAILDHACGEALMHSLRSLQDRGGYFTTLAEIRNRADLVVCIATDPVENHPEFFRRCSPADQVAERSRRVFLGVPAGDAGEEVPLAGDLFDGLAYLAARLAGHRVEGNLALDALARRMQAATYTVLVWEPAGLPAQGALIAETIQRLVNTLNRTTRAAAFALGGGDGGATANQVLAWLSGLPLRTGVHRRGLVHEPLRYGTEHLLASRAVDALLWISSFDPKRLPPPAELPRVVLGHPDLAAGLAAEHTVFIPVSTPGVGSAGHLFRTDGVVVPLHALYADPLPTVAQVVADLAERLPARGKTQ